MSWPELTDYYIAVQSPRLCFVDADLKRGTVLQDALGLPKPATGNFAVVFRIRCAGREYAVKCFMRPVVDQQQRYAVLAEQLKGQSLPFLVDFKYLNEGIRLGSRMYPIVKMEWTAGQLLDTYVEGCLATPQRLRQLAVQWRAVVNGLRKAGIAHGDLQHGNIIVVQGGIRLVDYDGMYVSALRGNPPRECGLEGYRHPRRTRRDYDESVDNFPALVIYLSLLAVAAEPRLWTDFHRGEFLILSKEDLEAVAEDRPTPVWVRLQSSSDAEVRRLAGVLQGACRGPAAGAPLLESVLKAEAGTMSPSEWRTLAETLGTRAASSPPRETTPRNGAKKELPPKPVKKDLPPKEVGSRPGSPLLCSEGHLVSNATFYCYCPECAKAGRTNALFGWRMAPCGDTVPDRAHYCPRCGSRTGW